MFRAQFSANDAFFSVKQVNLRYRANIIKCIQAGVSGFIPQIYPFFRVFLLKITPGRLIFTDIDAFYPDPIFSEVFLFFRQGKRFFVTLIT